MKLWYETGGVAALCELPRDRVVCLDVETTGLNPRADEVLRFAIVRGDGETLLSRYVRPVRHESWPAAQRVHGISPSTVVLPACAGMILRSGTGMPADKDVPRACGDDPRSPRDTAADPGCSPRLQG